MDESKRGQSEGDKVGSPEGHGVQSWCKRGDGEWSWGTATHRLGDGGGDFLGIRFPAEEEVVHGCTGDLRGEVGAVNCTPQGFAWGNPLDLQGEEGGEGLASGLGGFGASEILGIECGNDSLKMILDPALATGDFSLLLHSALGLGVDVGLDGHHLAETEGGQQSGDKK